jgi:hypothetical protein
MQHVPETDPQANPAPRRSRLVRVAAWSGRTFLRSVVFLFASWCALALFFDFPIAWLGWIVPVLFFGLVIWQFWLRKSEWARLACVVGPCLVVVAWWLSMPPSNDREWDETGAVLTRVTFEGDVAHVRNVRNFHHLRKGKFEARYYDRDYDLDKLEGVDLICSNFLGEGGITHTLLSFRFTDGNTLCLSIEPRMEKGEPYSIPRACFHGFEIIYHFGDERDILYECTNIIGQDVYLYRLNLTAEQRRTLCVGCLERAEGLAHKPEWYNFITNNCTNNLLWAGKAKETKWYERDVILNGYGPQLLHSRGLLAQQMSFEELKAQSNITPRAKTAGDSQEYSKKIREGLIIPEEAVEMTQ